MMPLFDPPAQVAAEQCLTIIKARGAQAPASIAYLRERTGLSERAIKGVVEAARVRGEAICASRGAKHGYFLASTAEEIEASAGVMMRQAKSMLLAASRLAGKHRIREFLGQLRTEVE